MKKDKNKFNTNKIINFLSSLIVLIVVMGTSYFMISNVLYSIRISNYNSESRVEGKRLTKEFENKIDLIENMESEVYSEEDLKKIKEEYSKIKKLLKSDYYLISTAEYVNDEDKDISNITMYNTYVSSVLFKYYEGSEKIGKIIENSNDYRRSALVSEYKKALYYLHGNRYSFTIVGVIASPNLSVLQEKIIDEDIENSELLADLVLEIGGVEYE